MARSDKAICYVLASPLAHRGVRVITGLDLPTRTVTRGATYRTEWSDALRAPVITAISRTEPAAPRAQTAPAGTPTAGRAQEAPVPAKTARPQAGVKAVGDLLQQPRKTQL